MQKFLTVLAGLSIAVSSCGQAYEKMDFEKYNPTSTLIVPQHKLTKAKFPFIDVHNHQFSMPTMNLKTLTDEMDKMNSGMDSASKMLQDMNNNRNPDDTTH